MPLAVASVGIMMIVAVATTVTEIEIEIVLATGIVTARIDMTDGMISGRIEVSAVLRICWLLGGVNEWSSPVYIKLARCPCSFPAEAQVESKAPQRAQGGGR